MLFLRGELENILEFLSNYLRAKVQGDQPLIGSWNMTFEERRAEF